MEHSKNEQTTWLAAKENRIWKSADSNTPDVTMHYRKALRMLLCYIDCAIDFGNKLQS